MRTTIILFIITVFGSCYSKSNKNPGTGNYYPVEGYWIPDSINWLSPDSGEPGIDTVIKYADFQTLFFNKDNCFYIFYSTQSFTKVYDSLIFEYEPGVSLYKGEWNFIDSTNIMVSYKFKEGSFKKGSFKDTIRVVANGAVKSLSFNGTFYNKTQLYKKESLQRMDAYKAE